MPTRPAAKLFQTILSVLLVSFVSDKLWATDKPLQIAVFRCDATPPIGSPLCLGLVRPAERIVDSLSARGIILLTDQKPIVLCVVDWVAISNHCHDAWRQSLADATGTTIDRVSVLVVHQHDAPGVDFTAGMLAAKVGLGGTLYDEAFAKRVIDDIARAASDAVANPQRVTHLGTGIGRVEQFASNRRVIGSDGKIEFWRGSSTRSPEARAQPEGKIDPNVRLLSFWNGQSPIVSISYYASHPQSYYGRGGVSADTVGQARAKREAALPKVSHLHFNGAGGNVAAGKYNDGSTANRALLAGRLAKGMKTAWESTKRVPVTSTNVSWKSVEVSLPLRDSLKESALVSTLYDRQDSLRDRLRAARDLAWTQRCEAGHKVNIGLLQIGPASVFNLPGELFIEYQLAAQQMRPNSFVCIAAYGDLGPGYIGTKTSYSQGGYEVGQVSRTAPEVEDVLLSAMRKLAGIQE